MVKVYRIVCAAVAAVALLSAAPFAAAQKCDTNPRKLDTKTSISTGNPAFAPFDNKCKGDTNITGACTKDEDCASACCDGKKCRAPDALKGAETCRDGLAPDFTNGLKFVKKAVGGGGGGGNNNAQNKGKANCKGKGKNKGKGKGKNKGKNNNNANNLVAANSLQNCDTNPRKLDTKTSISTGNPAFAPFDNKCKGDTNITGACTKDEDCASACCDGKKCRAPDTLKGAETCRDGLAPDFTNGLKFVKKGAGGNNNNQNNNNQNNNNQNNNNNGGQQNCDTNPRKKDTKTSISTGNPAFAPFDNKCKGETNITGACTKDEDCASACCDGKKCRAPDALKGAETCRDGLAPDFTNGLKFVKKAVGGGGGNNNNNQNNNQNNNNNNNGGQQNCDTNPRKKDTKTSISTGNPAFAPFDNKCKGETNITGACTKDEDCASACCDGKKCRAPDALKGAETCRDGLAPDFTNGLRFVRKAVGNARLRA